MILTVEIYSDGQLGAVRINQVPEHENLSNSAIQFAQQAIILVVTRSFHFLENKTLSSSDASAVR